MAYSQGDGHGYHPTYKKVKVAMPHCPRCGEQLRGNGSMVLPYRCDCGTWDYSYSLSSYEIKALTGEVLR